MGGLLDRLRGLVAPAAPRGYRTAPAVTTTKDDKIALGGLLGIVAEADGRFLAEEKALIEQVLRGHADVDAADLAVVMASVEQAAEERIDLYQFTREVAQDLTPPERAEIVRQLYRVGCADGTLDHAEVEAINQISGLLRVPHRDMIDAKLTAKREFAIS